MDTDAAVAALERRRLALEKLDTAKFSWYHVRAIIVAGVGFYTDAYDLFAVNFANVIIGYVYTSGGTLPTPLDTALKAAAPCGNVLGQAGFGILADVLGRKRMYGIELIIMIVATIGLSLSGGGPSLDIFGVMIFWRVILGMGVGGDYPLSSIITSEFATVKWRGAMMAAVFANQGWGQFTAAFVSFLCTVGFKNSLQVKTCDTNCKTALDKAWRIIYGFGAVPALCAVYYRLTIPETIRYTLDVSRNEKVAAADAIKYVSGKYGSARIGDVGYTPDAQVVVEHEQLGPRKGSVRDFFQYFGQWKNGKVLFGTAASWFVLDVAFYGVGLNTSIILAAIGYAGGGNVYEKLYNTGAGNVILSCAGLIPGYWVSVATIDTIGRKPIQLGGFIILTILFCIIGFGYHKISTAGLFTLICLSNFFQNFGPNTTTFIVPGEVFPTRYRSTGHGFSAACGKLGAILAQGLSAGVKNRGGTNAWINHLMQIFALFMLIGCFTTLFIPETKRQPLEEMTGETSPYSEARSEVDHVQAKKDSDMENGEQGLRDSQPS